MAPSISDAVTIDRVYFETILRRANYNNDGLGAMPFAGTNETIIPVPKADYENLLLLSRQFANLKRSLLGAGVTEENIATLVQDATGIPQSDPYAATKSSFNQDQTDGQGATFNETSYQVSAFRPAPYTTYGPSTSSSSRNILDSNGGSRPSMLEENHGWAGHDHHEHLGDAFAQSHSVDGPADSLIDSFQAQTTQPTLYARICKRTIALCGLPSLATLGDVTSVVRGGQLLDIFLRSPDVASVSFVRQEDAVRFYEHARKNDLYIRNKRVHVKWADRHFILPGHVANKLAGGASRNMIIRRCGGQHTEDSVRDDLEHIHNLNVIKVEFVGGSCYIKTNSVHNAMFAKTCMMSRAKYKGSRIEWDLDECDQPLQVIQRMAVKPLPQRGSSAKKSKGTRNRFDMLRLDDDDNHESDDKFDTSSEMPSIVGVAA